MSTWAGGARSSLSFSEPSGLECPISRGAVTLPKLSQVAAIQNSQRHVLRAWRLMPDLYQPYM